MEADDTGDFISQKDSLPYKRINHRVPFKLKVSCILKEDLIYKKLFRKHFIFLTKKKEFFQCHNLS